MIDITVCFSFIFQMIGAFFTLLSTTLTFQFYGYSVNWVEIVIAVLFIFFLLKNLFRGA